MHVGTHVGYLSGAHGRGPTHVVAHALQFRLVDHHGLQHRRRDEVPRRVLQRQRPTLARRAHHRRVQRAGHVLATVGGEGHALAVPAPHRRVGGAARGGGSVVLRRLVAVAVGRLEGQQRRAAVEQHALRLRRLALARDALHGALGGTSVANRHMRTHRVLRDARTVEAALREAQRAAVLLDAVQRVAHAHAREGALHAHHRHARGAGSGVATGGGVVGTAAVRTALVAVAQERVRAGRDGVAEVRGRHALARRAEEGVVQRAAARLHVDELVQEGQHQLGPQELQQRMMTRVLGRREEGGEHDGTEHAREDAEPVGAAVVGRVAVHGHGAQRVVRHAGAVEAGERRLLGTGARQPHSDRVARLALLRHAHAEPVGAAVGVLHGTLLRRATHHVAATRAVRAEVLPVAEVQQVPVRVVHAQLVREAGVAVIDTAARYRAEGHTLLALVHRRAVLRCLAA